MNIAEPRSSFPTSKSYSTSLLKKSNLWNLLSGHKRTNNIPHSSWKPSAFRPWVLLSAAFMCWTLIIILQLLLTRSQRDGGIIFASDTDELPFSQTFLYLYLPTVIAILFSIFWAWIDLQIKRLEPYYQLSKPGGSLGKESLLLQYPFDFIPFVPISAVRNRHWAVFWASTAIVVVTWGLVPVQAGIFASETITKTSNTTFALSTNFLPADKQNSTLTNRYITSTHGIVWLNETLPPYMTRDYALKPFRAEGVGQRQKNETWTADTQLYSVDLSCEVPKVEAFNASKTSLSKRQDSTGPYYVYTSSNGCQFPTTIASIGNATIGKNELMDNSSVYDNKGFAAIYIGYYATDFSSYDLEEYCPEEANHTFLVAFSRNKKRQDDPPHNATRLYCKPFYYVQGVEATVDAQTKRPISVVAKGLKQLLPSDMWDSKLFEYAMNEGATIKQPRGDFPTQRYPNQLDVLSTTQLSLGLGGVVLQNMVGLAYGASNRPMEELLDQEGLRSSYEAIYRIIFARSMTEILDQDFSKPENVPGQTTYITGTIVLVPAFVFIVEGLLGFVSICALALLYIAMKRRWSLHSDPATISSVMSLVADNPALLGDFSHFDCATMEDFEGYLEAKKFRLHYDEQGNTIKEIDGSNTQNVTSQDTFRSMASEIRVPKPVRPREFRSFLMIPFISLQIALAITLGVLLLKSQPYGIARPSNNSFVRQIFENYLPTAIATFIEPIWILVNRLLCMLQPLEELRRGNAVAKKSIDADYSSLPPQLTIFKALKSSHFTLAAACLMALLANLLAIAFSGIFEERNVIIPRMTDFHPPFEAKFVAINGAVGPNLGAKEMSTLEPSGAYAGGLGTDQFLVAESHYTTGNPLPPWVDDRFSYIPFTNHTVESGTESTQAQTNAFGATLNCTLMDSKDYVAEVALQPSITARLRTKEAAGNFQFTGSTSDGKRVTCSADNTTIQWGPPTNANSVYDGVQCHSGAVAMELVLILDAAQNATDEEQRFCAQTAFLGWVRDPGNICERNTTTRFDRGNSLFIACRGNLMAGSANVAVNGEGRVQNVSEASISSELSGDSLKAHFSNDENNLIEQAHRYLFHFPGVTWHNDSFASDYINYFLIKQSNDSRLVNPRTAVPTFEDVTQRLYPLYSKLFAIWLGINKDRLLIPTSLNSTRTTAGQTIERHSRIFLSKPLFVVAEVILGVYALAAFGIYLWRPGRFLPRLPTSIAAILSLFAASSAVYDLTGTSLLTKKERRMRCEEQGQRYGYGTFVGADGRLHVGIEKEPLVDVVLLPGVVQKAQSGFSKRRGRS